MRRRRFEVMVSRAVRSLPLKVLEMLDNVAVVIEERPTPEQLADRGLEGGPTMLGLYEGVPLTQRGAGYGMVLPDKITLFQKPIEEMCETDVELRKQIQRTVIHEVAHHFGLDDDELNRLGWG